MIMSTITKVLAGLTGVGVAATGISLYHDFKVGEIQEIPDQVEDVVAEDPTVEAADEILNSAE